MHRTKDGRPAAVARGDTSIPLRAGTMGGGLRDTAARFPDRVALLWAEGEAIGRLTYARMLAEAERIARWILTRAAPGDRVAIWSRNNLEWMLLEYGCALSGTVIAAWNPAWMDPECEHARDLTDPALIFASRDVRGVDLLERARALAQGRPAYDLTELRQLAAGATEGALPDVSADDLFLIQFTSGTTGRAKGAALSHRAALNAAWLRAKLFGQDEHDIVHNPVPMNHMGGAVTMLPGAILTGSAYVVSHRFEAGDYVRLLTATGATRIGGVPTMLTAILDHPDWRPGHPVRSIGLGGTQVPQTIIERVRAEFDAPVLVVYAQSECPMISTSLPGDDLRMALETVGRVAPHVELKVCDPRDGHTLAVDAVGEIVVRSPMVMDGYFRMPEATAAAIDAEGFLHTGDLGTLDAEGYVRIHGRVRDVIIRGGENIYPAEIEDVMLQHPAVQVIAAVGAPDERYGQQVAAAVILREGTAASAEELEAFAAARLAHFKVPRRWRFETSLPLTAAGKIRKNEVEKWFAGPQDGA